MGYAIQTWPWQPNSAWPGSSPTAEARGSLLSIVANPCATRLTGHNDIVYSVAFNPDGHTLATCSGDNTARLRETNIDDVATRICHITAPITKSEWDQYLGDLQYRPPCPQASNQQARQCGPTSSLITSIRGTAI